MVQRSSLTSLSLQPETPRGPEERASSRRGGSQLLLTLLLLLIALGFGAGGYELLKRMEALERQMASLSAKTDEAAVRARQAADQAAASEDAARRAAEAKQAAEIQTVEARAQADAARAQADTARETAARAQAEAQEIRKHAQAEINRLDDALGKIAETRRTALGLVMNLGGDHLKFQFDKAELRSEDKELLSRIAGILSTATDTTISVNGHTDDVGSDAYNLKLSEKRAQAVYDYLIQAGLPADVLTVRGHGKSRPLVPGTTEAARAKNRRVELGIADSRLISRPPSSPKS